MSWISPDPVYSGVSLSWSHWRQIQAVINNRRISKGLVKHVFLDGDTDISYSLSSYGCTKIGTTLRKAHWTEITQKIDELIVEYDLDSVISILGRNWSSLPSLYNKTDCWGWSLFQDWRDVLDVLEMLLEKWNVTTPDNFIETLDPKVLEDRTYSLADYNILGDFGTWQNYKTIQKDLRLLDAGGDYYAGSSSFVTLGENVIFLNSTSHPGIYQLPGYVYIGLATIPDYSVSILNYRYPNLLFESNKDFLSFDINVISKIPAQFTALSNTYIVYPLLQIKFHYTDENNWRRTIYLNFTDYPNSEDFSLSDFSSPISTTDSRVHLPINFDQQGLYNIEKITIELRSLYGAEPDFFGDMRGIEETMIDGDTKIGIDNIGVIRRT